MHAITEAMTTLPSDSRPVASVARRWFVRGWYRGSGKGARYFTVCFNRRRAAESDWPPTGHSLHLTVLEPEAGRRECHALVSRGLVDGFLRAADGAAAGGLERHILDSFVEELRAYGPSLPIRCREHGAVVNDEPFSVEWDDFSLVRRDGDFHLSFVEPEGRRACCFRLQELRPPVVWDAAATAGCAGRGSAWPRLQLSGHVDGEEVEGAAWLDCQDGPDRWDAANLLEAQRVDWLRVNLDDGTDLLITQCRSGHSKGQVKQFVLLLPPRSPAQVCHGALFQPTSDWQSSATGVCYPVAWRLAIAEAGLDLCFEPLTKDQEVPVFGLGRSVWEGEGTVRGVHGGQAVTGRAGLAMSGYGDLLDFPRQVHDWIRGIDRSIAAYFPRVIDGPRIRQYVGDSSEVHDPEVQTHVISRPVWDLLSRGGKHWRPVFAILLLESMGVPAEPYETLLAATTELTHTGSLIVDDIEDNSRIRRGDECIHLRYGLDVAINAANAAYFLPYLVIRDHTRLSDAQRLEIYTILSTQFMQAHMGQGQDIYWSRELSVANLRKWQGDSLAARILGAYAWKTAAVIGGAAEIDCVIAGAAAETRQACARFARSFGTAFQILDDVLDFSPGRVREGCGGKDLAEGKITHVILSALERLAAPSRERLEQILCNAGLRQTPSAIQQGIELVRGSGALASCCEQACRMVEDDWRRLSEVIPPSTPKTLLRILCKSLLRACDDGS